MRKLSFVDTGCTHSRVYALEQSSLQDTVPARVRMQKQGMLRNRASTTVSYDVTSFQGSKINKQRLQLLDYMSLQPRRHSQPHVPQTLAHTQ